MNRIDPALLPGHIEMLLAVRNFFIEPHFLAYLVISAACLLASTGMTNPIGNPFYLSIQPAQATNLSLRLQERISESSSGYPLPGTGKTNRQLQYSVLTLFQRASAPSDSHPALAWDLITQLETDTTTSKLAINNVFLEHIKGAKYPVPGSAYTHLSPEAQQYLDSNAALYVSSSQTPVWALNTRFLQYPIPPEDLTC
jgi:hypothetical protein